MKISLLRSLLVIPLLLAPVLRAPAHSAVESAPRPDDSWKQRQEKLNASAAAAGEKAQVIFIGDSITQGWEGAGKDVWARYYAHRNAVNLGIGGDRTQHVLWRLDNGNLQGLKPKAAVLMIGTNNSNGEDNSIEQIADGIAAIVARLREKLPEMKILLLPIFPRSENPSAQRGKVLQVNQIVQKLADEKSVYWVDFGHRFVSKNGSIPRSLMPDYLHLSPEAYGVWAESIEPRLASILGGTPVTAGGAAPAAAVSGGKAGGIDLSGEWVATMPGPNQEPIDMPFSLKQEGARLTGRFARPDGRWLELKDGKIEGNAYSWTIQRDRPDGTSMTYQMSGKIEGGKLVGSSKTEMGGNPITLEWSAKRQ